MNFEIPLVIDEDTLKLLPERENKHVKFLLFWLQEKSCKAVVTKSAWKSFFKIWEEELKDCSEEFKNPFYQFIRGVVRPYRKEGYEDEEESENPAEQIIKIVNRDYDIVEFIIVSNPSLYNLNNLKVSNDQLLTLKDFYTLNEVENTDIFRSFSQIYGHK